MAGIHRPDTTVTDFVRRTDVKYKDFLNTMAQAFGGLQKKTRKPQRGKLIKYQSSEMVDRMSRSYAYGTYRRYSTYVLDFVRLNPGQFTQLVFRLGLSLAEAQRVEAMFVSGGYNVVLDPSLFPSTAQALAASLAATATTTTIVSSTRAVAASSAATATTTTIVSSARTLAASSAATTTTTTIVSSARTLAATSAATATTTTIVSSARTLAASSAATATTTTIASSARTLAASSAATATTTTIVSSARTLAASSAATATTTTIVSSARTLAASSAATATTTTIVSSARTLTASSAATATTTTIVSSARTLAASSAATATTTTIVSSARTLAASSAATATTTTIVSSARTLAASSAATATTTTIVSSARTLTASSAATATTTTIVSSARTLAASSVASASVNLIPANWVCPITQLGHTKVELARDSEEFRAVMDYISRTKSKNREIAKIERIENPRLWRQYEIQKEYTARACPKGHLIERRLFHGTNSNNLDSIMSVGFDRSFAGASVGTMFGQGTYFSTLFDYSASKRYAKDGEVLVCDVLIGQSVLGHSSQRVLPFKPNMPGVRFESAVNHLRKPTTFVVYADSAVYPAYVIKLGRYIHGDDDL